MIHFFTLRSVVWTACVLILLCCSLVSCQSENPPDPSENKPVLTSVCPGCGPSVGGETGDFGGTPTICSGIFSEVEISKDEIETLGYFDFKTMQHWFTQDIDEPLVWETQDITSGEPASGYKPETQVRATLTVDSYTYWRPDPAYCDEPPCTWLGVDCDNERSLTLKITADVETLDGAVHAKGHGILVMLATSENEENNFMYGDLLVNLHEVTGSLQLNPSADVEQYHGILYVSFKLRADSTWGEIKPYIYYGSSTYEGFRKPDYFPIRGEWGRLTTDEISE